MTLAVGAKLGPYEIQSPLGAGGMGEVYRAKDTRLGRDVAIKVLPEEFFEDKDRVARFEREAKSLAAVSHPHIAALFSFEETSGRHLLVMEVVEGQTLADRLLKGPLPPDQVLRTGIEIASALDAAHRAGIVHRDLKPANVMLTRSGVKLLDFGLAKALGPEGPVESLTSAPTTARDVTREGAIFGTLSYMAPEQLEGKGADRRTDIFAFGAVLYEMATGKKAFSGSSQASLIAAIMSSQPPPIRSVQPVAPPLLDGLVRRCLARDPEERWQSAADVAAALRWIEEEDDGKPDPGAPGRLRRREALAWGAAGALLLLAFFMAWRGRGPAPPSGRSTRFHVDFPSSASFFLSPGMGALAVSPDGGRIVFVAGSTGKSRFQLWIRYLDQLEAIPLPGTEGAISPFWSPDGSHVAFFAGSKLRKVAISGGPPQVICDTTFGSAGTWSPGGFILFNESSGGRAGIFRVPEDGGNPVLVTKPADPSGPSSQGFPELLPDGRRFLFLNNAYNIGIDGARGIVSVGRIDSGEVHPLFEADSRVEYVRPGYLLFVREGVLLARPFDADRLALTGEAVPVASGIGYFRQTGAGVFSASATGNVLVYQPRPFDSRLVWLDREGRTISTLGGAAAFNAMPRVSPDGRRVAAAVGDPRTGARDVWIYDVTSGLPTRLTFGHRDAVYPIWSPDGSRIAFGSARKGSPDIYVRDLASGLETAVLELPGVQLPNDWSPDGSRILYRDFLPAREPPNKIGIHNLSGSSSPEAPPGTPRGEYDARYSPDGRFLSLVSEESGEPEVYVVPIGDRGERRRVSAAGGSRARWRRDGRELYFLSADDRLMAVAVSSGAAGLEFGQPRVLFAAGPSAIDFDVGPEAGRFLFQISAESGRQPQLVVNLNWTSVLPK